ncbi:MAG TPA: tripartite tricarboxylate transporter permease [Rhabdaerophilum sp.]|nr:tripartite tricarboxylate transporter permease [Rhabdaerophilum sp.]
MQGLFANLELGLAAALSVSNVWYCFLGVFIGMLVGVLPGIGAVAAISMLFPFTFGLPPTSALIMVAGIYYGTAYGGSITAILLNVPGQTSSAVACLDGYPMARQGRGGIALFLTTAASFVAGSIGILIMMFLSPLMVKIGLMFGAPEYFALMLLGLVTASAVTDGSAIKAIAMVVFGVLLGAVGPDFSSGLPRFTFGFVELLEGISLVAISMGLFGIAEVIISTREVKAGTVQKVTFRSMIPTRDDVRRFWAPTLRGTSIGSIFGTLPGTGSTGASFVSYAVEKRVAKDPSRLGKGAVEGVCAPEAANNAADQTAFIPTLTLGIPGSATMALILGVLIIHGVQPGPRLMIDHPEMFWGLVMSFWVGNLMLVLLNIPLIGLWVRMLQIPYRYLYPAIILFVCIGTYSVGRSVFDVFMVVVFGALGYLLRMLRFPIAPVLLGFVLGPMLEDHFRRTMLIGRGNIMYFFERPISATMMVLTILVLAWGIWGAVREARQRRLSVALG